MLTHREFRVVQHVLNFLKGAAMGAADVVPGVSGGTVALIVGIYERLIHAITSVDREFFRLLLGKQIRGAAEHIDWKFVLALGTGLATGFIVTVKTLAHFLEEEGTRSFVLAAFLGMVVAATVVVAGMVIRSREAGADGRKSVLALMTALGFALSISLFFLNGSRHEANTDPGYLYIFLCGAIAICAMILPGVSGALVLILLGVYETLVGKIKAFLKFEDFAENLIVCVVFGLGCVCGLMLFSRILRRLLERHHGPTLMFLCGLMLGSLPFLWPFQVNTTPGIEEFKERVYQPAWPEAFNTDVVLHLVVAVVAAMVVVVADRIGRQRS